MSRDMDYLEPNFRTTVEDLLVAMRIKKLNPQVIQTWRPVTEQAKKYRCTRGIAEITAKADYLIVQGREDLAKVLMDVGPQSYPKWLEPHKHLTMAGPGESNHHMMLLPKTNRAWAYATDIVLRDSHNEPIWDDTYFGYEVAGELAVKLGLVWLGNNKKFSEAVHYQAAEMPPAHERLTMVIE